MQQQKNIKVTPELNEYDKVKKQNYELNNGPLNKRECRDIFCCLLFIASCVSCFYIFSYGYKNGQPLRLFSVYDKQGAACGLDEQSDRKYLYFYAPYNGYLTQSTCIAEFPTDYKQITSDCNVNSILSKNCNAHNCSNLKDIKGVDQNTVCYYPTQKFISKICLPTAESAQNLSSGMKDQMNALLNSSTITEWLDNINKSRNIIAGSICIAFSLGLVYMILLRIFSGFMVWIAIYAYLGGITFLGYLSYKNSITIKQYLENNQENGSDTELNQKFYYILSFILWGFACFCFLALMCMYTKIRQAIAIIKATTQYITDVCSVLLIPPIFTIFNSAWFLIWLIGFIYLYSCDESGTIQKSEKTMFANVVHSKLVAKLIWVYLFLGLWINAFIQTLCQFILASSACIWYFSHGQEGQKHAPIRTSIYRAFRYHLGSLAFGALLLAIVQFIRIILAYIEKQMNKVVSNDSKIIQFILKCMQCYMACFERFIKFLNKNAYIQIALKGQNFCVAAKDALAIIVSNIPRVLIVSGIGNAFIFLGKLFITCATTFIGFLILNKMEPYKTESENYLIPCIVIAIVSYYISAIFLSVYEMGISKILICFLEDEKISKQGIPHHAPPMLQEFFEEYHNNKN